MMFIKKYFFLFLIATISLMSVSCNSHVYKQSIKVPDNTWHYDSMLVFNVYINDTSSYYDIYFKFIHTEAYPYANLWVKIIVKSQSGAVLVDTANFWFLDKDQRWIGTGVSKNWIVTLPYKDSVKFTAPGNYQFYIQHIMQKDNIPDIKAIGLIIDKHKI